MFPGTFQSEPDQDGALDARVDALEQGHRQVVNTLRGLTREVDVSIGCICPSCDESYMLQSDGEMYCPQCGNRTGM